MKYNIKQISLSFFLFLVFTGCSYAQISKKRAENKVKNWYSEHPDSYNIILDQDDGIDASIGKSLQDSQTMIIKWKKMTINLYFQESLRDIEWTKENLQQKFAFVVIDDIEHDLKTPGWELYPRTPSSSNNTGVTFLEVSLDEPIKVIIDWETYTFFGYSQKDSCQDELQIADNSISEGCYLSVKKRLPLHIELTLPQPNKL